MTRRKSSPHDIETQLREATREAREALGDLKRDLKREKNDIRELIDQGFQEYVKSTALDAREIVVRSLDDFTTSMKKHSDEFQKAIENRWTHIATMLLTTEDFRRELAIRVLKEAGGTIKSDDVLWHLVKEAPEDDGSATFAFPASMGWRAQTDPRIDEAIRDAMNDYRPNIELQPWSTAKQKGINEQ